MLKMRRSAKLKANFWAPTVKIISCFRSLLKNWGGKKDVKSSSSEGGVTSKFPISGVYPDEAGFIVKGIGKELQFLREDLRREIRRSNIISIVSSSVVIIILVISLVV